MAPDQIVAEPTEVSPGAVVEVSFPEEMVRGILFTLDERVGDGWVHRFNLTSDGWYLPGDESVAFPDIGVVGPGPDPIEVPRQAEPGEYRLCTGNAGTNVCTEIRVVAP